ncbi:MAG: chorismate mutase [Opitutaceae bacterium]|nr:chorismate mutase [Opitutaceae bacterium]
MKTLSEYRESIDNLDAALIALLAERFKITQQVGLYKASHHLSEKDESREEKQMANIDELSQKAGLRPEIARRVIRVIIEQVIAEHKEVRKGYFDNQ